MKSLGPQKSNLPSSGNLKISVSPIDLASVKQRLSVGATMMARILDSHGGGKYTVGFAGLSMVAESPLDLPRGSQIYVRVESFEPRIHLKLIDPDSKDGVAQLLKKFGISNADKEAAALLKEFMDLGLPLDKASIKKGLIALKNGLTPREAARFAAQDISLKEIMLPKVKASEGSLSSALSRLLSGLEASSRSADASKIRDALTFSGDLADLFERHPLKMERRILGPDPQQVSQDVKALLIKMTREDGGQSETPTLAKELLDVLEGHYLFGEPEPEIPFVVDDDGMKDGSISAERTEGRAIVRIRLDTSKLGQVVGVLDFQKKKVGMSFGVPKDEGRDALKAKMNELRTTMKAFGFDLESLTVDTLREDEPSEPAPLGLDIKA
ncbi:MAG: flagellar hook-length control protein FliK [Candidatus Lindowbacteria bacterium]|nr:flagellar hook-length control protein FliK [Candidatus Lindowbacteria bacterium]